jgi:hypothetical protein
VWLCLIIGVPSAAMWVTNMAWVCGPRFRQASGKETRHFFSLGRPQAPWPV